MRLWLRIACALAVLAVATGCSRDTVVKIGVAAPLEGEQADFGKELVQGAAVAVDELNRDHFVIAGKRVRFELVAENDRASPEEGKAVAKRLIGAGVAAVLGHLNSDVSIAAAPLYANAGIAQMSLSTHPRYTRMGLKTAFRIAADDIEQGMALGRFIGDRLRPKSVWVIDDGTTFGAGLADEVMKVLASRGFAPPRMSVGEDQASRTMAVRRIREADPDLVFYGGDERAGVPLLKALREEGVHARFVAGDGMCDANTVGRAGAGKDGGFYCSIAGIPPSWLSSGIDFTRLYQEKYGKPGSYAPLAYDGIHILAQAMQRARSADPEKYLPQLAQGSFDGKVQGVVEFDGKGDLKEGTIVIYRALGGQLMEQRNAS